jgi:hypothetical protein
MLVHKAATNQTTAPDFFVKASLAAQQLAIDFDAGRQKYDGYKGKKFLSEIVYGRAGIGRMPTILDKKKRDHFWWMTRWLDGYSKHCSAEPKIGDAEKLRRFAIVLLQLRHEPATDWSHFFIASSAKGEPAPSGPFDSWLSEKEMVGLFTRQALRDIAEFSNNDNAETTAIKTIMLARKPAR